MGELSLKRAAEVVISPYDCGAGEDGRIEVVICDGRRTWSAGRRVRQVGEAELFGHRVGDVDIGRLAGLEVVVHGLDN
jgi:hypothetical protein